MEKEGTQTTRTLSGYLADERQLDDVVELNHDIAVLHRMDGPALLMGRGSDLQDSTNQQIGTLLIDK